MVLVGVTLLAMAAGKASASTLDDGVCAVPEPPPTGPVIALAAKERVCFTLTFDIVNVVRGRPAGIQVTNFRSNPGGVVVERDPQVGGRTYNGSRGFADDTQHAPRIDNCGAATLTPQIRNGTFIENNRADPYLAIISNLTVGNGYRITVNCDVS